MKKVIMIWIIAAIVILMSVCTIGVIVKNKHNLIKKEATELPVSKEINVVPTMNDTLKQNSSWCGTFQLVWNDMKNKVVKKDIVFSPQEEMAINLNKGDFTEKMISDEDYYKIYGLKTLKLKKQIEQGIKKKFNKDSKILNDFDWSQTDDPKNKNTREYFFYTMLYKKFEFEYTFDKLKDGKFGDNNKNVKYFGIDGDTNNLVGNSISVLYYNSKTDFAIIINTKDKDQLIFVKSPEGTTFKEMLNNMNKEATNYMGSKVFEDIDEFKAPNIAFNTKREYKELQEKTFPTADPKYPIGVIKKAIQSIEFNLDETGGTLESEAAIDMVKATAAIDTEKKKPRYFYLDDTFTMFLREKGQSMPYFAIRVDDISKFQ